MTILGIALTILALPLIMAAFFMVIGACIIILFALVILPWLQLLSILGYKRFDKFMDGFKKIRV